MSRVIKFRVWSNERGLYNLTDEGMRPTDGAYISTSRIEMNEKGELYDIYGKESLLTYEQFTGLKDSQGKDIYEGDIVEGSWNEEEYKGEIDDRGRPKPAVTTRKENGRIEWGHAGWKIVYPNWLSDESGPPPKRPNETYLGWFGTWPSTLRVKVIGNIHETQELLK